MAHLALDAQRAHSRVHDPARPTTNESDHSSCRYPVSERGRKSRSADFPVRSIVRTPTCTQFAARLCENSFLPTGKSALRPSSLTGYIKRRIFTLQLPQHGI